MGIKTYNPVTPGQRGKTGYTFDELTTDKPYRKLLVSMKKSGGRNSAGRITIRFRGGGHKRKYRLIDFKRDKFDVPGNVDAAIFGSNSRYFLFGPPLWREFLCRQNFPS